MSMKLILVLGATALLGGCASMPAPVGAARNVASVSMDHYTGTWLEIGRRPMSLTDGCVAGFSTYMQGATPGKITVLDGCHKGTPSGKLETIGGPADITDYSSANAKMRVHYPFFITWNYWVLYEAPDHGWFISADPEMKNLWIYARKAPTADELKPMVAKAQALGYDTSKLEFPAQ